MADTTTKKNKGGSNITITNQVTLDAKSPVPFQYGSGSSIFSYSVTGKRYIPFLGPTDNFPTQLLEARLTSTTQNACINSIAESLIAKGIFISNEENPKKDLTDWFKSVNNLDQSINEILKGCGDGFLTHGNQFIEIVRGSFANKKFVKIYLHSMMFTRLGKVDPDTGICKTAIISKSFARNGFIPTPKDGKEIPLYNPNALDPASNWVKDEKDSNIERTMLHLKNEVSGMDFYGLPPSVAGLRYQVLEGKSAQYNLDNFENNMVLGGMLIFKGAMTQDEANKNAKEILISHVGEGKTGRIAVISSEQGLDDVEWKPYETQKDGSFIELDKRIEEKIIAANGWDRRLAGLDRDGGLSNGDTQLASIYGIKETMLLNPIRKKILDKIFLPVIRIWSDWTGVKEALNYNYDFKVELPLSFYGDIDPETFIKVKEARESAKLTEDAAMGEKYLSEMKLKGILQNHAEQKKGGENVPA